MPRSTKLILTYHGVLQRTSVRKVHLSLNGRAEGVPPWLAPVFGGNNSYGDDF